MNKIPLVSYIERKIEGALTGFFDLLNDCLYDEKINHDVRLTTTTTTTVVLVVSVINGYGNAPYTYEPSLDNDRFEISSYDVVCLPVSEGHQALLKLTQNFSEALVINKGIKSLVFDGEAGNWAVFIKNDRTLCHAFSGVNFKQENPDISQDILLSKFFGEAYLNDIKSAKGNLITLGVAI